MRPNTWCPAAGRDRVGEVGGGACGGAWCTIRCRLGGFVLSRPARSNGPAAPPEPGDPASGRYGPLQATNSPREPWQLDRRREPRPRRRSTRPSRWGALQGEQWVVEGCIPRHLGCVPGCRAAGLGVRCWGCVRWCWGCVRWCRRSFGLGCWWGAFATAFLGQFGHHTLALTVLPTSQGVRVRQ